MARPLNELSIAGIAEGVAAGAFTAEAVMKDCLARIAERDATVHAWSFLDPELALEQARACSGKGALAGVPIGIKDVIETKDMPTDMGSPIYRNNRTGMDASCVAMLRAAGAIILGKTVTCEFAGVTPGATTHPMNPVHTPGGSSSGSGAAVADDQVPGAFGTQTGGSVLRPAAFCGIVGYKPSYGLISRDGIKFAAESFDTIGIMTRGIDDADLIASVLMGRAASRSASPSPPRIGVCRTYVWDKAKDETIHAIEDSAARLAAAGAKVGDVELPTGFSTLTHVRATINAYERARAMAPEWNGPQKHLISDRLTRTIEDGLSIPHSKYLAALRALAECRRQMRTVFSDVDVLLTPVANGEAPMGLDYAGDPAFQEIWTMLHAPAITLPTHRGPNGLPVGIQLVGEIYEDERLLAAARWISARLGATTEAIRH